MTEALPIIDVGAFLEKRGSRLCARVYSANQHFCQLAKPSQDRKRSKHLEQ